RTHVRDPTRSRLPVPSTGASRPSMPRSMAMRVAVFVAASIRTRVLLAPLATRTAPAVGVISVGSAGTAVVARIRPSAGSSRTIRGTAWSRTQSEPADNVTATGRPPGAGVTV